MRILIVEDDLSTLQAFRTLLEDAGYEIIQTTTGEDALTFVRHNAIDGAVVDLTLKGASYGGMTFIRKSRNEDYYFPVLVVTAMPISVAKDDVSRSIGGSPLDYADDYIEKRPGRGWLWEVRDRLRNMIIPTRMLICPPYKYDRLASRLYRDDAPIDPGARESRILECLMQHPGRVVPSAQIYDLIHDQNVTDDDLYPETPLSKKQRDLVHQYILRLRHALDPDKQIKPIQAVTNAGYRFRLPSETRRSFTTDPDRVIVGRYQLEIPTSYLVVRGEDAEIIQLQSLECRILELLMRSAGVMRSRVWIHERVYGANDMTPLPELDARLLTLRNKINRSRGGPLRTFTDTGFYCFTIADL